MCDVIEAMRSINSFYFLKCNDRLFTHFKLKLKPKWIFFLISQNSLAHSSAKKIQENTDFTVFKP